MFPRRLLAVLAVLASMFPGSARVSAQLPESGLFARTNLVAWCIVPFDSKKRGPEERAAMLQRLGIRRLAYDWRTEHLPTFDAEIAALDRHGIELTAWWFPAALNAEARAILDCLARNRRHPQLWVTMGTEPETDPARLAGKIEGAVGALAPICAEAAKLGSVVGLYNHLGWFGEPANQVRVIAGLRAAGHTNVGCVYNFHHGHAHIDRFAEHFRVLQPHLIALNLNGMIWDGDRVGKKIIPLGTGDEELDLLRLVRASGWKGPVGIIGHTDEDAEVKLKAELSGLARLAPLTAQPPGPARKRPAREPETKPAALLPPAKEVLVEGRSGKALDARVRGVVLDGTTELRRADLTVEAWVRLSGREGFNILVASEAKASASHWELYTYAGSGELSFYSPGLSPAEIRSGVNVCDGTWHHVAAQHAGGRVRLFVDGRGVADTAVSRSVDPDGAPARWAIGRLVEGGLGCDGWVDDVRIRRGPQPVSLDSGARKGMEPVTLAFWDFDGSGGGTVTLDPPLRLAEVGGTRPVRTSTTRRAAGEPGISGREPGTQGEKDWVDNRWQETQVGQWLASVLPLPTGAVAKGLSIKVGKEDEGTVAYDTASGAFRAAWQGGFLQLPAGRFGLIDAPKPDGTNLLAVPAGPGWPGSEYRFVGFHRHHQRVALEHRVNGVRVLESPWLVYRRIPVVMRTLNLDPSPRPLRVVVGGAVPGGDQAVAISSRPGLTLGSVNVSGREWRVAVKGAESGLRVEPDGRWVAEFPPSTESRRVVLLLAAVGSDAAAWESVLAEVEADDLRPLLEGDSGRFLAEVKTLGQRGPDTDFLAVDTLTMPYDNPWQALLFASGVDFTPDGAAYVCTMHGDVWRVTGIDDSLRELRWKRFATGLFQPLGLKVRDGEIFVLGRDRITRLRDLNGDGEADFYESFHDGIATSTGGHDYVTSLERDEAGNFYYIDPVGVHRVRRDGSGAETLATGFRNPNGMGVSPDGRVITAAPQQGTWTPSSGLWEVRPGLYGGYGGPKVTPERPQGFDAPLLWIPHGVDNSSGGQAWIPPGVWGPLGGQMIHLLWGRCSAMLILREAGEGGPGIQGAAVPLPVKFLSGPNRATFRPQDGHLYVAGSTGWQTSAVKDGALQRVRYTGRPAQLPTRFRVVADGMEVGFAQPLERTTAEDPGSYALKRWNYRYSQDYGSKDWSVTNPGTAGRDDVEIAAAKLLEDGRTVRLRVPSLTPAMQMELKYNLDSAGGGRPARGQFWFTVNRLGGNDRR